MRLSAALTRMLVAIAATTTITRLDAPTSAATQWLHVSSNGRFLVQEDGSPFFWTGDTAWRLYKLTRPQIDVYLDDRAARGFNVIQGPVLLHAVNNPEFRDAYGNFNGDPLEPNLAYYEHIDYIVNAAEARNLYVALVGVWGNDFAVLGATHSERRANARTFGKYVGKRYRNRRNVVFIVAGEYSILGTDSTIREVWNALANGLRSGSAGKNLISIHASYQAGQQSSSVMFHNASWLDFNMIQSSQSGNGGSGADNWNLVLSDYGLAPVKPTIDSEAHYEGFVGWDAFGVRRRAYWSVFAGAFGHTYGSIPVAVSYRGPGDEAYGGNYDTWLVALGYPGAGDMRHLRRLMESRPMLKRVPADHMLLAPPAGVPDRIIATRDQTGRYAMVYVPDPNRTFTVNVNSLSGSTIKAWWYDCRDGKATSAGQFSKAAGGGVRTFTTPAAGEDWVLVLDDKSQAFAKPGIGGPLP